MTLPNCQPLQKENWHDLAHIADTYENIWTKTMLDSTPEAIEAIENEAARWTSECATISEAAASSETALLSF
jgi:hypothetical protein